MNHDAHPKTEGIDQGVDLAPYHLQSSVALEPLHKPARSKS